MIVARFETVGTPVEDPDYPQLNIGYDDIQTGILFYYNEDDMADDYASGEYRSLSVICEIETLGL